MLRLLLARRASQSVSPPSLSLCVLVVCVYVHCFYAVLRAMPVKGLL
jgi:hypothetical protein